MLKVCGTQQSNTLRVTQLTETSENSSISTVTVINTLYFVICTKRVYSWTEKQKSDKIVLPGNRYHGTEYILPVFSKLHRHYRIEQQGIKYLIVLIKQIQNIS